MSKVTVAMYHCLTLSSLATLILICVSMGTTIHHLQQWPDEKEMPFDNFDSKFVRVKIYHSLFFITFLFSMAMWIFGVLNMNFLLIAAYSGITFVSWITRLTLFLVSDHLSDGNDDDNDLYDKHAHWLAYGSLLQEILVLFFYLLTAMFAAAASLLSFHSPATPRQSEIPQ